MGKVMAFIVVACIASTTNSLSQNLQFQTEVGPFGDVISEFCRAPDGSIYIGSGRSGVFHSTDNGRNWDLENRGLADSHVQSLAIDAVSQELFVSLKNSGIYRFDYSSRLWSHIADARFPNPFIMVSGSGSIYAYDTTWGVDRSLDAGQTWMKVFIPGEWNSPGIFTGAVFGNDVLIGTKYGGVYHSSDQGEHWSNSYTKGLEVSALHYSSSGIALMSNSGESMRSTDRGASWMGFQPKRASLTSFSEEKNGTLWATNGSIHCSVDSGKTWRGIAAYGAVYRILFVDSGIVIHAARNQGLGFHPDTASGGYNTSDDFSFKGTLTLASTLKQTLLTSIDRNAYRSTTQGLSWAKIRFGDLGESGSRFFTTDTIGGVYARLRDGSVWKSENDGVVWRRFVPDSIAIPDSSFVDGGAIRMLHVLANGDVFVSTKDNILWWTTDDGHAWRCTQTVGVVNALCALSDQILLIGTDTASYRSENYGASFTKVADYRITAFDFDVGEGVINAGSNAWIYRSSNGGLSWSTRLTGLSPSIKIKTFFRPSDSLLLAAGQGLTYSRDAGLTWANPFINNGSLLQIVKLSSGDILAANEAKGLQRAHLDALTSVREAPHVESASLFLSTPWPNPAVARTSVTLSLQKRSAVRCRVYTVLGQNIATIFEGEREAGVHALAWDGRADNGMRVPSGVYFIVAETNHKAISRPFLYLGH
jgi:photosystem II stability/assembly factor-like uncharacterized protein